MKASYKGHTEVVKALLAVGADVNQSDKVSRVLCLLFSCVVIVAHMPGWLLTCGLSSDHLHGRSTGHAAALFLALLQLNGCVLDPDSGVHGSSWPTQPVSLCMQPSV